MGISPAGAVMFLPESWGGRVSEKQITLESGFLSKIQLRDCIVANRGSVPDRGKPEQKRSIFTDTKIYKREVSVAFERC